MMTLLGGMIFNKRCCPTVVLSDAKEGTSWTLTFALIIGISSTVQLSQNWERFHPSGVDLSNPEGMTLL